MNEPNDQFAQNDQLDHLLRQWDEQRRPSEEQFRALRERISAALTEQTANQQTADNHSSHSNNNVASPPQRISTHVWRTITQRMAAVAALLFLAVCVWQLQPRRAIPDKSKATPQFVRLDSQQLENQAILLAELEQVFDGQLVSIAETDGKLRLGLEGDAASIGEQPLAIRVVLARREKSGAEWKQVWTVDIVSHSQCVVRLNPETEDGVQIAIWAYVLPDGMIAVDTNLSSQGSLRLQTNSNGLQRPGEPTEFLSWRDDGTEYRVYQTVALLNEA